MIKLIPLFEAGDPYLKWKRANVTYRGVAGDIDKPNSDMSGMMGCGLYTAHLSNKAMARQYGKVYFVYGARPKKPLVVNSINDWEMWEQRNLYNVEGKEWTGKRDFEKYTTIEKEVQKLGYDGVEIKGREMVNYEPGSNVKYFETEYQLKQFYNSSHW